MNNDQSIPSSIADILDATPVATAPATPTQTLIAQAGLNWTVSKHPLVTDGETVKTHMAVRRSDTKAIISVVGADYVLKQNSDAFVGLDDLLSLGHAVPVSAGSFKDGRIVYARAAFKTEHEVRPGDAVRTGVMIVNGHDGSRGHGGVRFVERLVCTNGLTRKSRSRLFSFRHTRNLNIKERTDLAEKMVREALEQTAQEVGQFRAMAARRLTADEINQYLIAVVPNPTDPEAARAKKNAEQTRDEIMGLLESGRGTEIEGVRGTLWGAYNAVTEYVDHERNKDHAAERRNESNWFGSGADMKDQALSIALAQYL